MVPMHGERIELVVLGNEHIGMGYREWLRDYEVVKFLEARFGQYDDQSLTEYIATINGSGSDYMFGIVVEDGTYIGNIKIGAIDWMHRRGEVGLMIGSKAHWGKGYATEAIETITRYGFDILNLHKLWAGAYSSNGGSVRAFEKAGYSKVAIRPEHFFFEGHWEDDVILERINPREVQGR